MKTPTKQPFIDNKRGATMEYAAHKAKARTGLTERQLKTRMNLCIVGIILCVLFLTSCASPYNHPGTPRTPDPAYEGWGE